MRATVASSLSSGETSARIDPSTYSSSGTRVTWPAARTRTSSGTCTGGGDGDRAVVMQPATLVTPQTQTARTRVFIWRLIGRGRARLHLAIQSDRVLRTGHR